MIEQNSGENEQMDLRQESVESSEVLTRARTEAVAPSNDLLCLAFAPYTGRVTFNPTET